MKNHYYHDNTVKEEKSPFDWVSLLCWFVVGGTLIYMLFN